MENSFVLIVLLFAALATGGLVVNWIGLGRAMSRLSVSAYVEFHQAANRTTNHHPTHKSPHQPSNRVLVYSESTAGMGPSAGAMDSVPRHSNFILRSRIRRLRPGRDFKYQPVTMRTSVSESG